MKVKQQLASCTHCGDLFPVARKNLGYDMCLVCGDMAAKRVRHTVVPLHKSNYIVPANESELRGINNKGGFFR